MKSALHSLTAVFVTTLALLLAGCGGTAKSKLDTTEFSSAFATADPAIKGPAEESVKALKAGKLFEGATALVATAKAGADKISPEQKNALINLGSSIQMVMSEDGNKADLKVYQAVEDLMSLLTDRESSKVGTTPDRVRPPQAPGQ